MPFLLCTYVRDSYNGYGKYPPGISLYGAKVGVFKLNTPRDFTDSVPIRAIEVAVPTLGTAKILDKRKLGLFAMYICTSSVRMYIAKILKHAIYANPL